MIRAKWVAAAVVLLIAVAAAWYFASPAYTLSNMRSAAQSGDADELSEYVDYDALREDLKADMMAMMIRDTADDEMGGLGLLFGTAMVGPMVDNLVTPSALKAAMAQADDSPLSGATGAARADDVIIQRNGLDEFTVTTSDDPDAGMLFKRHGLSWKLSGIDLPKS